MAEPDYGGGATAPDLTPHRFCLIPRSRQCKNQKRNHGMTDVNPFRLTRPNLLVIVVALVFVPACGLREKADPADKVSMESRLQRVKRTRILRVGYGGYPPYLVKGSKSGEVSGMSVDMINRIVAIWNRDLQIQWIETSWDRVMVDFKADKFDVIVEPLFRTIARASELNFTRPYTYSGYGVAVIRTNDTRFRTIQDFNQAPVTVAVTQSSSSDDFVRRVLPKVQLRSLPTGNLEQPLLEVMLGRSDAAFSDVPTVTRFLGTHGSQVKALFYDNPPVLVGAGFMIPQGDYPWASFLNVAIDFLETTGELKELSEKYHVPYYETVLRRSAKSQ